MGQIDDVMAAVSKATEVSVSDIVGRRRFQHFVEARCLFCAICLAIGLSLGSVSGQLGVSRQAVRSLFKTHEIRTRSYSYRVMYRSAKMEYRKTNDEDDVNEV